MKKILALLIFMCLLTSCNYKQENKMTFSGTVESTQIDVYSEINAKISEIKINEGNNVSENDIISQLDNTLASLKVQLAQNSVDQAQARYNQVTKGNRSETIRQAEASYNQAQSRLQNLLNGSRPEEINRLKSLISKTQENINSLKSTYNFNKTNYEKVKSLYESGSSSQQQLDQAKLKLDQSYNKLQAAKNTLESQQYQLELLQNKNTKEMIDQAKAQVESAKAHLDLVKNGNTSEVISQTKAQLDKSKTQLKIAKEKLKKTKIKAPISGTISSINVDKGEVVFPGTNIATISKLKDLWVKIYIPQKHLNKISLGEKMTLNCSSIPNSQIKGEIVYIASEAEFTPKNTQAKENKQSTVFEVKIKILDNIDKLKPGMIVDIVI